MRRRFLTSRPLSIGLDICKCECVAQAYLIEFVILAKGDLLGCEGFTLDVLDYLRFEFLGLL